MKKTLLAAIILIAFICHTFAQESNRGMYQGETFELSAPLLNGEDNTYTASNYIKLLPGFNANPESETSTLLHLGLDEYGIYPPDNGLVNSSGCVVGALGGTINIGAMGGLNYTIPIEMPVGINGMQPSIAISYNSQGGNGLMGWGWDLHATSCITRTGQTIYHDGRMTAADLSKDDRFLLDGQRLIAVNSAYGEIPSYYKTENDCLSKICLLEDGEGDAIQNSRSGGYFKIWDRSGNVLEYRDKLCSPDGSKVILWMLSSISDRNGNSIRYHYETKNETGEIKLANIDYTINETHDVPAEFQVQFLYKTNRKDYERYFIGGCQLYYQDILEAIKIIRKDSGKPLYIYHFNYFEEQPGLNKPLYSILNSIDMKAYSEDGHHEKINSTTIEWDSTLPNAVESYNVTNSGILEKFPFTGDFNGDGFTDVALVPYKSNGQNNYDHPVDIQIFLNDRNHGFVAAPSMNINSLKETLDWVYILDIDGDGLDDIVPYFYDSIQKHDGDSTVIRIYRNNRHSFGLVGEKYVENKAIIITGDFDGNSTTDVILLEKKDHVYWGNIFNPFDTRMITYLENIYWMGYQGSELRTRKLNSRALNKRLGPVYDAVSFDYNGDGINEVFLVGINVDDYDDNYGSKLAKFDFNNSTNGLTILETYREYFYPYYNLYGQWCHMFPGDYNGDGKTDLIFHNDLGWKIGFSSGDRISFFSISNYNQMGLPNIGYYRCIFPPSLAMMNNVPPENRMMVNAADFDGDGCTDIAYAREWEGACHKIVIASRFKTPPVRNLEFRRIAVLEAPINVRSQFTHVGNFLGRDNMSFLETIRPSRDGLSGNACIISPVSVSQYHSVASVTDGLGNRTSFAYDCLMPAPENEEEPFYSFTYHHPDQNGIQIRPMPVRALRTCETEGINGSSTITRYSYENAYTHKYGHGFMGFEFATTDTYRNSLESGWKTRKTSWNEPVTMGSYAMMLPYRDYGYVIENNQPKLIGETAYKFTNVTLANNSLVVCPAMLDKTEISYSLDDSHQKIKTVRTKYDYDYATNHTYDCTYNCNATTQTTTGYANGQSHVEQVMNRSSHQYTNAQYWILSRPDWETVVLTRNGETTATHTEYEYENNKTYRPNLITVIPNNGSQPNDPLTTVTHIGYDEFGNTSDVVIEAPYGIHNEQQRETHYQYGSLYNHRLVTKETKGDLENGFSTSYHYDFLDRISSATDCNAKTILTESSPFGTLQKTFPIDNTEQRTLKLWADDSPYKPAGASYYTWSKKTGGVTAMTFYHKSGLELRSVTFDFGGNPVFVDKKYNGNGLLEKESAPYRQGEPEVNIVWTIYDYDDKERVINIQYPGTRVKHMDYHGLKTTTTLTPEAGEVQKSTAILNAMGWSVENIDAVGTQNPTSVRYEYYPDGNLKWARINGDETTTIRLEYDHAGNRTLLHDPDYCTDDADLTSSYNAFGEEVSTTTPKGFTTTYCYDQYGRMIQRIEEDYAPGGGIESKATIWHYYQDASERHKGLLRSIHYPSQSITYSYDEYQRVSTESVYLQPNELYATRYFYDPASRKSGILYTSGFSVNYHYNSNGYLKEITDEKGNPLYRTDKVNPMGQIERFTLGNNTVGRMDYHPEKHTLTHISATRGDNILQNLSYDYDGFCNLARRTDNIRNLTEGFTYDHLNRLTEIRLGLTQTGSMKYDEYGRMIEKTADDTPVFFNATYNLTSKPHALDKAEVAQDVFPSNTQTITYTCFDKVRRIEEGDNTLEYTYGYDQQRIRMEEHANGTIRTKRYVGGCERVTLTDGTATTTKILTYLNSPIGIFAVVEKQGNDETIHYVLKDHLGSWTTITDAAGNIEQELSFDAWGNLRDPDTWTGAATETPLFDRGFTGHEHLYAFGLINMNGRMYDPLMSSFLSVDRYVQSPENSQNFNRYAYCLNNPLKYTDPSGWVMVGGMKPSNPFHENWGKNFAEPVCTSSGFNNANYLLNQALYGNEYGGGVGFNSNYVPGFSYNSNNYYGDIWVSNVQIIFDFMKNPCYTTRKAVVDRGLSNYSIGYSVGRDGMGTIHLNYIDNQDVEHNMDFSANFHTHGFLGCGVVSMNLSLPIEKTRYTYVSNNIGYAPFNNGDGVNSFQSANYKMVYNAIIDPKTNSLIINASSFNTTVLNATVNAFAKAELLVDGKVIESKRLQYNGETIISQPNSTCVGFAAFTLPEYGSISLIIEGGWFLDYYPSGIYIPTKNHWASPITINANHTFVIRR